MTDKKICDVSIISANYNNGKYLDDFIKSIICSTVIPKELILIDDGSTDDSINILERFNLPYMYIIKLQINRGFANALNEGIRRATGTYIMRVDPDDILKEDRIEKQYTFLESNKKIDIVGCNVLYFSQKIESVLGTSNFSTRQEEIIKRYHSGEHGMLHGTIMGKAYLFKENRYNQKNVPAEDYDIFSRMIKQGARPANLQEILTYIRIHKNSVSNNLPFSTVEKTYELRDKIFNSTTSRFKIVLNYLCVRYYRKYYFENNIFKKAIYLSISSICRPDKAMRRILNK